LSGLVLREFLKELTIRKAGYFLNFEKNYELSTPISGLIVYYPGPKEYHLSIKSKGFPLKVIGLLYSVETLVLY
jgi:hypothetical protein